MIHLRRVWVLALALLALSAGCDGCGGSARTTASKLLALPYLKGQLHMHSSRSTDCQTAPAEVLRWYRELGFDFVVFTDHNRAGPPLNSTSPLVLSGIELTQNLRDCSPPPPPGKRCAFHVNGLLFGGNPTFLDPWRPEVLVDRRAAYRQALAAVARAGGLAQVNHPNFTYAVDVGLLTTLVREDGLRFFEVANGSRDVENAGDATHPSAEALWDAVLSAGGWLYGTATDDAHHYDDASAAEAAGELATTPGHGFVMVRAALDRESIRAALLRGDFYASSGVILEKIESDDGALSIEVAAASAGSHTFSFIGTGGKLVLRTQGRGARCALAHLPAGYLRAVVEDGQGKKAWVQPIRIP